MKITFLTPALVAILGLAFASAPITAQAQSSTNSSSSTAPAPAKDKKTKPTPYTGTITAIDASSVTVAGTKKTLTLAITSATTYKKDKEAATLSDFAVGDAVTGSYTTDDSGALTAHSIHKKTAKPAASSTPAPAAAN